MNWAVLCSDITPLGLTPLNWVLSADKEYAQVPKFSVSISVITTFEFSGVNPAG